jgi:hypothetical protein
VATRPCCQVGPTSNHLSILDLRRMLIVEGKVAARSSAFRPRRPAR